MYQNGEPLVDDESNFPHGSEVNFKCIESIMGEKTTWRIVCEDGNWIGRSFNCGITDDTLEFSLQNVRVSDAEELLSYPMFSSNDTCVFRNQEPNVISFYNDQAIREDMVEFPAGTTLVSRCIDIGKYAMIGRCYLSCDWWYCGFVGCRSIKKDVHGG